MTVPYGPPPASERLWAPRLLSWLVVVIPTVYGIVHVAIKSLPLLK